MTVLPADVMAEARLWLGVPFLHQGRTRGGVDCIGLILVVCHRLALLPPTFDRRGYGRLPEAGMLLREVQAQCRPSPALEPGGLLVMRFARHPQHFALLSDRETIIHAYLGVKRVVEVGFRAPWPRRVLGCYRLPGVTYE